MSWKPMSLLKRLRTDQSGLAGVEFALISTFLIYGLLNGLELARWYLQQMQVKNAAHSAAHAAWKACDINKLPAKTNCPGLNTAISNALASTSLGTAVTATSTEGYYCIKTDGTMQSVGNYDAAKPANCGAAGDSSRTPGDYLMISASYTFAPMFPGFTVGSRLPTGMTATSSMRLL